MTLFADNDIDALEDFFSEHYERYDRRTVVSGADVHGRAELRVVVLSLFDVGIRFAAGTELAVRGERLCLGRGVFVSKDDLEISFLAVTEIDVDRRIRSQTLFDPDALAEALEVLDGRYIAGEGAPHSRALTVGRALWVANRDLDFDTVGALLSPDLVSVDHQRIGFGTGDREDYLANLPINEELARPVREIAKTGFTVGNAFLIVHESIRTDAHGSEYEWLACIVMHVDDSDRLDRIEWFALEDWDAALARLDELGADAPADPRHPRAETR